MGVANGMNNCFVPPHQQRQQQQTGGRRGPTNRGEKPQCDEQADSRPPRLTVETSTPNVNVDGLEELKVTTTITNTGDETLKLINDPRGVLDPFPENSFRITDAAGFRPSFNGAKVIHTSGYLTNLCAHGFDFRFKVKSNPLYAAGLDDPSVFTVLAPGVSVHVTRDRKWDRITFHPTIITSLLCVRLTRTGAGEYIVEPSSLFTYVDANGTPAFKLSGNLAVSRIHEKRASSPAARLPGSCRSAPSPPAPRSIPLKPTHTSSTYRETRPDTLLGSVHPTSNTSISSRTTSH